MQDLTRGRINTNNMTADEWGLVNEAYGSDWFVPTDEQWLLIRNLFGLLITISCGALMVGRIRWIIGCYYTPPATDKFMHKDYPL